MGWRRRLVVAAGVVAVVAAGCSWVGSDPARYGVRFPPIADDADRGDAYVVAVMEQGIRDTLGPYRGPTFALTDLPRRYDVVGPTGHHSTAELIEVTALPGDAFAAEAHGILRMQSLWVSWLLPSASEGTTFRCRAVSVRFDQGDIDIATRKAECPPA